MSFSRAITFSLIGASLALSSTDAEAAHVDEGRAGAFIGIRVSITPSHTRTDTAQIVPQFAVAPTYTRTTGAGATHMLTGTGAAIEFGPRLKPTLSIGALKLPIGGPGQRAEAASRQANHLSSAGKVALGLGAALAIVGVVVLVKYNKARDADES